MSLPDSTRKEPGDITRGRKFTFRIDPPVFWPSVALILGFVVWTLVSTESVTATFSTSADWLKENLGWFYIFGVTVFLGVTLAAKGRVSLEDFERAVTAIPEVQTVQHVLGNYDYRLRVAARDLSDFERVLRRRIMTLPGVGQVDANVLLSEERRPGPL